MGQASAVAKAKADCHQRCCCRTEDDATTVFNEGRHLLEDDGLDSLMVGKEQEKNNGDDAIHGLGYFQQDLAELRELADKQSSCSSKLERRPPHRFRTKAVYMGQWKGFERHGFGVQSWSDGATYIGQWENNCASGRGRFRHSCADKYIGEWKDNETNGYGVFYYHDGRVYKGQWFNDLHDGLGVEEWPEGFRYEGQFRAGQKEGYGIYTWPDSSSYCGAWECDTINGPGVYVGSDGRVFKGTWKDSVVHGMGKYRWPDDREYAGQYVFDTKEGFGVFTWPGSRTYEGYWSKGKEHGPALLTKGNHVRQPQMWHEGRRVRKLLAQEVSGTARDELMTK